LNSGKIVGSLRRILLHGIRLRHENVWFPVANTYCGGNISNRSNMAFICKFIVTAKTAQTSNVYAA